MNHVRISPLPSSVSFRLVCLWSAWKGRYQNTDNTKIGKERGNSYRKNEEISRQKDTQTHGSLIEIF
jgi:hypothetical protein